MTRVAAIGEAMIELLLQGDVASVGVAGDTLNTAIYLKRTAPDIDVDYITCLGDDPFSDKIEDFIQSQNIGVENIRRLPGQSPGLYAIHTTEAGERSFTYWRSDSAARRLFHSDAGYQFNFLEDYDLIYLSGISVAILPYDVRLAMLDWLNQTPVDLAYDSNYRPKLWEDQKIARTITSAFWNRANICLPSIDDEMVLRNCSEAEVVEYFQNLGSRGALKRGANGPISLGSEVRQPYASASNVVDTTAAGDSFNGGYLASVLHGKSQDQALLAGHELAAKVVGYRGAIMPRSEAQ